jgi:predicted metal-dependent phosphoesterase TrpH
MSHTGESSHGSSSAYRGIIHFHSRYSPDSWTGIGAILRFARKHSLDFLILTDHDTLRGSRELQCRAAEAGVPVEVPLAAEYRTSHGDVIAAFLQEDIHARQFPEFVAEVRRQGGLLLLPHPFVNHAEVEVLAEQCDLIEVFNGRAADAANRQAASLAGRLGKPVYWASDAHLARNLAKVMVAVQRIGDLKSSLTSGDVRPQAASAVSRGDVVLSQLIHLAKSRDWRRAMRLPGKALRRLLPIPERLH